MAVLKILELVGTSKESWSDAAREAVNEAAKTVRGIETWTGNSRRRMARSSARFSSALATTRSGSRIRIRSRSGFFVPPIFETLLSRLPSVKESAESTAFLSRQAALYRDPAALTAFHSRESASLPPAKDSAQRARESLAHVIINHNDFVTIH